MSLTKKENHRQTFNVWIYTTETEIGKKPLKEIERLHLSSEYFLNVARFTDGYIRISQIGIIRGSVLSVVNSLLCQLVKMVKVHHRDFLHLIKI